MDAIEAYFTNLSRLLKKTLRSQRNAMEESARRIANAIRNGGMVYTFGTGHGHLLALEVFYRAGGLACICPMLEEALMLHRSAAGSSLQERDDRWVDILLEKYPVAPGDVCIVASNSGRNAVPVLLAQRLRAQGTCVIALTSLAHSAAVAPRNRAGLRLYETADIVLDNGGTPGDASFRAADGSMVGPTSTAVGAAILQAIVCRVKELALAEGFAADFFQSSNMDGGDAWNARLLERYRARVPGLA